MLQYPTLTDPQTRRGFTLVELLVVIGIIVLLISILIPTVAKVREAGFATDTRATLGAIEGACQSYMSDHRKYPGPLAASQVGLGIDSGVAVKASGAGGFARPGGTLEGITGTENLVLGLLGGLVPDRTTDPVTVEYDPGVVGQGPTALGVNSKGYQPYFDVREDILSMHVANDNDVNFAGGVAGERWGRYVGEAVAAQDTIIPELLDEFPSRMPILYLRANPTGFSATPGIDTIATADPVGTAPFAARDIAGYVQANGGLYIGEGRKAVEYAVDGTKSEAPNSIMPHGLRLYPDGDETVTFTDLASLRTSVNGSGANYTIPFDLRAALLSPSADKARQDDRFILISAGADRVYGTRDDITNFGGY